MKLTSSWIEEKRLGIFCKMQIKVTNVIFFSVFIIELK